MGKKRIIKQIDKDVLAEKEKVDKKLQKEISIRPLQKFRKGKIYISSSYNNTIITLTDSKGNVLFWKSAGSIGFKGTKKGTSFASSQVAHAVAGACEKLGIKEVDILIRGIGSGRDTALKTLANQRLEVQSVRDVTPVPHNGCRPPKPRRM